MQQVNLYTAEFRPKKIILPLEHIISLAVLSIVLVGLLSIILNSRLAETVKEVTNRSASVEQMRVRVDSLSAKAALLRKDESLVFANERLRQQLSARKRMIGVLDRVVVKDDDGFSGLMLSLARQKADDLWLTRIQIASSGHSMMLEGSTLNADAVPRYLQNLRNEAGFVGRAFSLFKLDVDNKRSNRIDFKLQSQVKGSMNNLVVSAEENSE